jgi:hypothetical protein
MALLAIGIVLLALIPEYVGHQHRSLPVAWAVRIHAAIMTAWIVFFFVQAYLGATRSLHSTAESATFASSSEKFVKTIALLAYFVTGFLVVLGSAQPQNNNRSKGTEQLSTMELLQILAREQGMTKTKFLQIARGDTSQDSVPAEM